MRKILEYSNYKRYFFTDIQNDEIIKKIRSFMKEFYGPQIYGDLIRTEDKILSAELLRKASNNFLLRNRIISDFNLSGDYQEFINFLEKNKYDLFHYDGKYFDEYYQLLVNATQKGSRLEQIAQKVFEDFAKSRGLDIKLYQTGMDEDKQGIDFKFLYKDKFLTIQVKPLKDHIISSDEVQFISEGDTREIVTDYLILSNGEVTFIIKSNRNLSGEGNIITVDKKNVLYPKI